MEPLLGDSLLSQGKNFISSNLFLDNILPNITILIKNKYLNKQQFNLSFTDSQFWFHCLNINCPKVLKSP